MNFEYQFQIIAAGEKQDKLTLYSPIYKGYPLTSFATLKPELLDLPGYGMFTQNYDSSKLSFVKRTVKVIPIDELNLDLTFVKIDVEGLETAIINSLSPDNLKNINSVYAETIYSGSLPGFDKEQYGEVVRFRKTL